MYDNTYTPKDKIARAKWTFYKLYPFFSFLSEYLNYIETPQIPTAAVDDIGHMFYSPVFVDKLSKEEVLGLLGHEVLHLALEHNKRRCSRSIMLIDPTGFRIYLWNIVADIIVNNTLVMNGITVPKDGIIPINDSITIFGAEIKDISSKSTEELYEELKVIAKQKANEKKEKGEGNGASYGLYDPDDDSSNESDDDGSDSSEDSNESKKNGKGKGKSKKSKQNNGQPNTGTGEEEIKVNQKIKSFDEHRWGGKDKKDKGKGDSEAEGDSEADQNGVPKNIDWKSIVAEAYMYSKQRGVEPAGFEREFQFIHTKKLNLDAFLRREIGRYIPYDYSFAKPNKRFLSQKIYMPSTHGEHINILFSVDTSGSVSNDDLSTYLSIIVNISRSYSMSIEFRIITHDTEVHDDYHIFNGNIEKVKQIKVHGGGGTDHRPLFTYIKSKKYHTDSKILFSFTDGYSAFPIEKPYGLNTVFILSGQHVAESAMPTWATTIVAD